MRSFDYQPFYCEENVVRLLAHPRLAARRRFALFITSPSRSVAVWDQRAGVPGEALVWDYHVIAVTLAPALVWDLDTRLSLPFDLAKYMDRSFQPLEDERLLPWFRLVPEDELTRTFATDRRHMRDPTGSFIAPPPPWPSVGVGHTLDRYLDIEDPIAGAWFKGVGPLLTALEDREQNDRGGRRT